MPLYIERRESNFAAEAPASVPWERAAGQKALCIRPVFIIWLVIEPLDRACALRFEFNEVPKGSRGPDEASLLIPDIGPPGFLVLRSHVPRTLPPAKASNKFGHSLTDEMVLETPAFKRDAGGGEV